MSPELRAFTALCGGVDSRDGPAAAAAAAAAGDDEGQDVGEEGTLGLDATGDWIEGEFPPLSG